MYVAPNVGVSIVIFVRSDDGTSIDLSWTPLTLKEARGFITGYVVSYSTGSGRRRQDEEETLDVSADASSATITELDPGTGYSVTVAGRTSAGVGPAGESMYAEGISGKLCTCNNSIHLKLSGTHIHRQQHACSYSYVFAISLYYSGHGCGHAGFYSSSCGCGIPSHACIRC